MCFIFCIGNFTTTLDLLLNYTGLLETQDQGLTYCWSHLIYAFSLLKNMRAILTTKQPPSAISSLNGIRVLCMFWIILCHVHVWYTMFKPINNHLALERDVFPRFWYQVILNGYFSNDSFFLLSGTLNAYNNFQEREKSQSGKSQKSFPFFRYYLHRYLCLTPVYAFVLLFRHLIVYFADGPMSIQLSTGPETQNYKNCDHYSWTNLLYINTIYPWKMRDMCMFWTWSLANDMQFYVIAPLILIPMYASIRKGLAITGTLLLASLIATGMIVGIYGFSPVSALQPFTSNGSDQTDAVYIKSYCRISPYLIGLVLGYILHHRIQLQLSKTVKYLCYIAMWATATATFSAIIFGLYRTWFGHKMSMTENIAFYTFSHLAWGLAVAMIVFACHSGYGWKMKDFLSLKIWVPLSRLTYCVSLIHPIILDVILGSAREVAVYSDANLLKLTMLTTILSYGAAIVLGALVEFPLSNIEHFFFSMIETKKFRPFKCSKESGNPQKKDN